MNWIMLRRFAMLDVESDQMCFVTLQHKMALIGMHVIPNMRSEIRIDIVNRFVPSSRNC